MTTVKKPLTNEEIDSMLKKRIQEIADLDIKIFKDHARYFECPCEFTFSEGPWGCYRGREVSEERSCENYYKKK